MGMWFAPDHFATGLISISAVLHMMTGVSLGGLFALLALRRLRETATLSPVAVVTLLASGPSLVGLLLCLVELVLRFLVESDTAVTLQWIAMISVVVPPLPGLMMGIVGLSWLESQPLERP